MFICVHFALYLSFVIRFFGLIGTVSPPFRRLYHKPQKPATVQFAQTRYRAFVQAYKMHGTGLTRALYRAKMQAHQATRHLDNRIPARLESGPGEACTKRAKGKQVQPDDRRDSRKEARPWAVCLKRRTPARKGKYTW